MNDSPSLDTLLALSDGALVGAWRFPVDGPPVQVEAGAVSAALGYDDGVLWLHLNLSNARAADCLAGLRRLPEAAREAFAARDPSPSLAACGEGVFATMADVAYDTDGDLSDRTVVWAWADPRLAVTARLHPASCVEALRQAVREGERIDRGEAVIARLYDVRGERLRAVVDGLAAQLDGLEDAVLDPRLDARREPLGRLRLLGARVRRFAASDRTVLDRFVARPPQGLSRRAIERFAVVAADHAVLLDEIGELVERAHLLQVELASTVAEDTNRKMAVLSTISAVLMPMTVATGLWGMNTGGVPGGEDAGGFWWVTVLVIGAGLLTLWLLRRFRLL